LNECHLHCGTQLGKLLAKSLNNVIKKHNLPAGVGSVFSMAAYEEAWQASECNALSMQLAVLAMHFRCACSFLMTAGLLREHCCLLLPLPRGGRHTALMLWDVDDDDVDS
jgi:hypothetical protein